MRSGQIPVTRNFLKDRDHERFDFVVWPHRICSPFTETPPRTSRGWDRTCQQKHFVGVFYRCSLTNLTTLLHLFDVRGQQLVGCPNPKTCSSEPTSLNKTRCSIHDWIQFQFSFCKLWVCVSSSLYGIVEREICRCSTLFRKKSVKFQL